MSANKIKLYETANPSRTTRKSPTLKGDNNEFKKSFSFKSQDSEELRIYLETGCISSEMKVRDVIQKYVQFMKYDQKSFSGELSKERSRLKGNIMNCKESASES